MMPVPSSAGGAGTPTWWYRVLSLVVVIGLHIGVLWGVRQSLNSPPQPPVLVAEILNSPVPRQAPQEPQAPRAPTSIGAATRQTPPAPPPPPRPLTTSQASTPSLTKPDTAAEPAARPAPPTEKPVPLPEPAAPKPVAVDASGSAVAPTFPTKSSPATLPSVLGHATAASPMATAMAAPAREAGPAPAGGGSPSQTPVRPGPAPPTSNPLAQAQPDKVELPSSDAQHLNNAKPAYPALSKRLGEQGRVVVNVLIGVDGTAQKAELLQSSGFERLDQTAIATALRWRYVPGKKGGVPQPMWFPVPIKFEIE